MNAKDRNAWDEAEAKLDNSMGKKWRIEQWEQNFALRDGGYAAGVRDAEARQKNPNHRMWFSMKEWRETETEDDVASPVFAQSPYELAARARVIQDDAAKSGNPITNIESCKLAYAEANVPWE